MDGLQWAFNPPAQDGPVEEGRLVQHLEGNISHFLPSANTLKGGSYQLPPWSNFLKKKKKRKTRWVQMCPSQADKSAGHKA